VGGKNPQQVHNRDKTLKIPFIFAAVPPHPNPPPPGGRERLLGWVEGVLVPTLQARGTLERLDVLPRWSVGASAVAK